jgi:hypothetical protein
MALRRNLSIPSFLIVGSPIRNLGRDINKDAVARTIQEIYITVANARRAFRVLLTDSDCFPPDSRLGIAVADRLMSPVDPVPPITSLYRGP